MLWGEPSTGSALALFIQISLGYLLAPSCPELGACGCFFSCCWTSRGVGGGLNKPLGYLLAGGEHWGPPKGKKVTPHPFLFQKEKIQSPEKPLNQPEPNNLRAAYLNPFPQVAWVDPEGHHGDISAIHPKPTLLLLKSHLSQVRPCCEEGLGKDSP